MTSEHIIIAEHLHKSFHNGVTALADFTARVDRGEVVMVIGLSGAGKSTFLRCLNGLEEIDSGTIIINSILLDDNPATRLAQDMGYRLTVTLMYLLLCLSLSLLFRFLEGLLGRKPA